MTLRELTPKKYKCIGIGCPAIYDVTPEKYKCALLSCPSIHDFKDDYLIVGKQINPKDVGLEKKVGKGEVLIKIKKEIIDEKKS